MSVARERAPGREKVRWDRGQTRARKRVDERVESTTSHNYAVLECEDLSRGLIRDGEVRLNVVFFTE